MSVIVFQHPSIFMPFVDNFICFCGNGMIEAMLEPHLKEAAGATQTQVGNSFLTLGALYMVSTPIAGYVRDSISKWYHCFDSWLFVFEGVRSDKLPHNGVNCGQLLHGVSFSPDGTCPICQHTHNRGSNPGKSSTSGSAINVNVDIRKSTEPPHSIA